MYKGNFKVHGLDIHDIPKVEELLKKRWKVHELVIDVITCDYLEISFLTKNQRKIIKLRDIIRYYGADVHFWIEKLQEERTHENL